ncbi:glycosyltransferase family 4 protein [Paraflavitalea sp. CAU 1676]|uniref:glycosyltransferase family 4 protein n=1 Tax=Paraflavitalea sp. CAU 1676 TaxID=3032598 RepID=UPI0023DAA1AA|nr:glycosyltransferase family 4 protein [Paraflavitalea sp. CAU 1676]MDF2189541.1 glycosyltransferase family 4 protein [Paraflavitalea sp. CAU 1676]
MKVVNIFYYYDDRIDDAEALVRLYYTTTGWAESLLPLGVESIFMTRFGKDEHFEKNNIRHYFIHDGGSSQLRAWQVPFKFLLEVKKLDADVVHVHSLTLSLQTFVLRCLLPRTTAIVVQHHGGRSPGRLKRTIHNLLNKVADAFFFTTHAQGAEWLMKQAPCPKVMPVIEGTTFFDYDSRDANLPLVYANRAVARQETGMQGSPVFLWVGRLDDNKDPLTVLAGFALLLRKRPQSRLYMIYSDNRLETAVKQFIAQHPSLYAQTTLLGAIPHEQMPWYYNSADYFVLGSHYEGCGYAMSEAMRCGCVPIVTDIPSFRRMTNEGQLGALWQPGNKETFLAAATAAMARPLATEAQACIDYYREHLSFDAIARVAKKHYQHVIEARRKGKATLQPQQV